MSQFRRNPNLTRELAREPWAKAMLNDAADAVEREAQRAAPLGEDWVGYYGRFVKRVFRSAATVGNKDVAAHLIEYGSVNNPPYAPLRRGVDAAGLRFADAREGAETPEAPEE